MGNGYIVSKQAPDDGDIARINRFTRRQFTAEEVYSFTAVLCDNRVDRDMECFSIKALEVLKKLFVGKTCIFDHDRRSSNQTARIYDTEIIQDDTAVNELGEPYTMLRGKAYLPRTAKNRDVITAIDSGILKEVSISCAVKSSVCSICGKAVCVHERGRIYDGKSCFRVLHDPTDAYECSFVAVPAQQQAGVVKGYNPQSGERAGEIMEHTVSVKQPAEKNLKETTAYIKSLEEKAAWGEAYRSRLCGEILKCSILLQPELPQNIMQTAIRGLAIEELEQMEKAYRKMAGEKLPLSPQLGNLPGPVQPGHNRDFTI